MLYISKCVTSKEYMTYGYECKFHGDKKNQAVTTNKKSTKAATYIGAGLGAGLAVRNTIANRSTIKTIRDGMVKKTGAIPS